MDCNCNEQGKTINIGMGCCVPIVANADNYYTKSEIDEKINNISGYVTTSDFIEHIQNLQDQITQLQIEISGCCGGEIQTRWITMTGENDYTCDETTKYTKEKEQASIDGIIWIDTGNYRQGSTVLELNSIDCIKWQGVTYSGSNPKVACSVSSVVEKNETLGLSLKTVEIGKCATAIGEHAFSDQTSLIRVDMRLGITTIGEGAFARCESLTSMIIQKSVINIGSYAFADCSNLKEVNIPNTVKSIEEGVFLRCSGLTSCTIPSGATSIGDYAFDGCSSLTAMIIPASVIEIGDYAFARCSNLETIYMYSTIPPIITYNTFFDDDTNPNFTIKVPSNSLNEYRTADGWREWSDRIKSM